MRDRPTDTHRTLTEAEVGPLAPGEVVDHADGDKANNLRSNRRVMDVSAHTAMHADPKRRALDKLRRALTMEKRGKRLY